LGKKNNILVTGCPRSGTTFLGKVLSIPSHVGYVREPFNRDCGLEGLTHDFVYLQKGIKEEMYYREVIEALLNEKASFRDLPAAEASRKRQRVGRIVFGSGSKYSYLSSKYNPIVTRLLLKDPMASLASDYMNTEFNVRPVVIIRRPIYVVGSMQRVGIDHHLEDLVKQRDLYNKHLKSILSAIQLDRLSLLERQSLLWTCINTVMYNFAQANKDFILVKHEDLSQDPHKTLKQLYTQLGMQYGAIATHRVNRLTGSNNPTQAKFGRMHTLRRNSRKLVSKENISLNKHQQQVVNSITRDVEKLFYPDYSGATG